MPAAATIDYFFSCVSPWSYFGHARALEIATREGAVLRPYPLDYSTVVFPATGGLPVGQRPPARRAYRMQELKRWRDRLGAPLTLEPAFFPADDTQIAYRIIALREDGDTDGALKLAGAAMAACWAQERDLGDAGTVAALCSECGLDPDGVSARADVLDAAAIRAADSKAAVERGVFGAPTYAVGPQLLWGQDRLDFLPGLVASSDE